MLFATFGVCVVREGGGCVNFMCENAYLMLLCAFACLDGQCNMKMGQFGVSNVSISHVKMHSLKLNCAFPYMYIDSTPFK